MEVAKLFLIYCIIFDNN